MGKEYCSYCGLLHDPEDSDYLECKLVKEVKHLKRRINCLELDLTAMDYDWDESDYPPGDFKT